ncbi:ArnT family glycosyltransferase [Solitalea koreensis]|uniref:4-amino-4-deoxy-L-arabinose transferase n=1 Tax=Solitalea koreensis TaxID=543615 RepID=A0A521APR6_9SPHI|nr:glycosyltransferase family 39 protein [Solitalea koreensis]SMO36808.1 4-amino-4-deoxy-L-arabinose transferase [Solitalea koreensis]
MQQYINKSTYIFLFTLCGFIYFLGLLFPLIDTDATKFAGIALRMFQHNDFVNIYGRLESNLADYDYLDKPHLLFWLAAASYKLFGISDWAYRLPSVLFTFLGAYSTYGLGRTLYNKEVGKMAALIFVTSQAIILANHDVRMDAILTGSVALGIWQLAEFIKTDKLINVMIGAAGVALGVSTKGMIAVFVTGSALFCFTVYLRKWTTFYNWKWLVGAAAFLLTLAPVLYCYYLQFDLHPEKFVNGQHGLLGIKFIFWTQSFDRLAGDRTFVSNPEFSFFYQTLLWAILPWVLIVYASIFGRIKAFWDVRFRKLPDMDFLTLGGLLIMLPLMSMSQFKLPHYLNVLFPMFAVLLASYLDNLMKSNNLKALNILEKTQLFTIGILILLSIIINFWFFPMDKIWVEVIAFILLTILFYTIFRGQGIMYRILVPSAVAILLVNFMLNANFYPQLLKYQAGNEMARIAKENNISTDKTYIYKQLINSFDFYSKKMVPGLSVEQIKHKNDAGEKFYVFVVGDDKKELDNMKLNYGKIYTTPQYRVSRLKIKFLNPSTRPQTLNTGYLIEVN